MAVQGEGDGRGEDAPKRLALTAVAFCLSLTHQINEAGHGISKWLSELQMDVHFPTPSSHCCCHLQMPYLLFLMIPNLNSSKTQLVGEKW
jgi:hypothetical protein